MIQNYLSWHHNIEFLVLTQRQSMDGVRSFAGKDIEKAIVEPAAVDASLDFDSAVHHYQVIQRALSSR